MQKTGNTAAWEDLKLKFTCARRAQVRVLVSSDDQLIGMCNFSRPRLLHGVYSEHGFYVVRDLCVNRMDKHSIIYLFNSVIRRLET